MLRAVAFIILFIGIIVACEDNHDVDYETMANTYVDLLIVEELNTQNQDTIPFLKDSIYNKYNISRDQFKSTFNVYKADQEKWNRFFDLASARIDTLDSLRKNDN